MSSYRFLMKYIFVFVMFLISLQIASENANAITVTPGTDLRVWSNCQAVSVQYNYSNIKSCNDLIWAIAQKYNIPLTTTCNSNAWINPESLEIPPHVLTYGDPSTLSTPSTGIPQSYDKQPPGINADGSVAEGTGWRYWGTNQDCSRYYLDNVQYHPDFAGYPDPTGTSPIQYNLYSWYWISQPWNNVPGVWDSGVPAWTSNPPANPLQDRYSVADRVIDKYNPLATGSGDFENAPGGKLSWLNNHMIVQLAPDKYSEGIVTLWLNPRGWNSDGSTYPISGIYHYDSFYVRNSSCIPELGWTNASCPVNPASSDLVPSCPTIPPGTDGQPVNILVPVKNNGSFDYAANSMTTFYRWDNDAGIPVKNPELKPNSTTFFAITYTYKYDPATPGTNNFIFNLNSSQTAPETNYNNNRIVCPVQVQPSRNAILNDSLKTDGTSVGSPFPAGNPIKIPVSVTNSMFDMAITAPCTSGCAGDGKNNFEYQITKSSDGSVVVPWKTLSFASGGIPVGETVPFVVQDNTILPQGYYVMEVRIPDYKNETSYADNDKMIPFQVTIPAPPNTVCPNNGSEPSRICIGYYPNYPSTKVEGGQGTYYYVQYFFFPEPMPNYQIQNKATPNQTVTYSEPHNALGDQNSYVFYPTTFNALLKAPYMAGPHSFYHYMYRGRLFAENVNFKFDVVDPMNQTIASGSINYKMPPYCLPDSPTGNNILDYNEYITKNGKTVQQPECRSIVFYLPNIALNNGQSNVTSTLDQYMIPPQKDSDKIHFSNPGTHAFHFYAYEDQHYYYQHDNGTEMEGIADGSVPISYGSAPSYTPTYGPLAFPPKTDASGNYVPDEGNNHCYIELDPYRQAYDHTCYHDHSAAFHWWKFAWSNPTRYNLNIPYPANQ